MMLASLESEGREGKENEFRRRTSLEIDQLRLFAKQHKSSLQVHLAQL